MVSRRGQFTEWADIFLIHEISQIYEWVVNTYNGEGIDIGFQAHITREMLTGSKMSNYPCIQQESVLGESVIVLAALLLTISAQRQGQGYGHYGPVDGEFIDLGPEGRPQTVQTLRFKVPVKTVTITRTVGVPVPVPYPVRQDVPVPVHVVKPIFIPVPQIVHVPHPVPVYGHAESAPAYRHAELAPVYGHGESAPVYRHEESAPVYRQGEPAQVQSQVGPIPRAVYANYPRQTYDGGYTADASGQSPSGVINPSQHGYITRQHPGHYGQSLGFYDLGNIGLLISPSGGNPHHPGNIHGTGASYDLGHAQTSGTSSGGNVAAEVSGNTDQNPTDSHRVAKNQQTYLVPEQESTTGSKQVAQNYQTHPITDSDNPNAHGYGNSRAERSDSSDVTVSKSVDLSNYADSARR
uniref:Uncharacterized protein n=1 Tax=Timema shepardi TaxID=629360 RepID=A0A7R9AX58_TIMSH|nr:unnamed protein product [Timema shepardi]